MTRGWRVGGAPRPKDDREGMRCVLERFGFVEVSEAAANGLKPKQVDSKTARARDENEEPKASDHAHGGEAEDTQRRHCDHVPPESVRLLPKCVLIHGSALVAVVTGPGRSAIRVSAEFAMDDIEVHDG